MKQETMIPLKLRQSDKFFLWAILLFGVGSNVILAFMYNGIYIFTACYALCFFLSYFLCCLRRAALESVMNLLKETMQANWSMLAEMENQNRSGEEWKRGGGE